VASGTLSALVIYPAFLEQTILTESLFSFLLLASGYALLVWFQEERLWATPACGALLGLAALTRPLAAGLFPVWAALLFVLCRKRMAARFLLWGGAAFLAVLLPLLIRNQAITGSFSLTQSLGRNLISVTDGLVNYDRGVQLPVKAIYKKYLAGKRG